MFSVQSGFVSGVGFSDLAWMFLDSHLRVFLRQLPKIRDVLARIIFWGGIFGANSKSMFHYHIFSGLQKMPGVQVSAHFAVLARIV